LLPESEATTPSIDITTVEGITVREYDWSDKLAGATPQLDPLASRIPADQHALFFPTFQSVITMTDEARRQGTPILFALQQAQDARSLERYQRQLGLEMDEFSRRFGSHLIQSVAVTGGDPYLRTGTDVAVLFETPSPQGLVQFLRGKQNAARQRFGDAEEKTGRVGSVSYRGMVTPDRAVCSYVAVLDENAVVVTNSLTQLERLANVVTEDAESMASLPEYQFFRSRYKKDDGGETAFLMITDAAIRRWCSPKWRIATSRRTRATAIIAEYQAAHLETIVGRNVERRPIQTAMFVPDMGALFVSNSGVVSSTYGTLDFQTPIGELHIPQITEEEKRLYEAWRNGYQSNWSRYFDPIAARFHVTEGVLTADLSVMPLIDFSDYDDFVEIVNNAELDPADGDRHPEALAHYAMAIDKDSEMFREADSFLGQMMQNVIGGPLSWMGDSVALYT
ncbi:MAG: hypothetical protein ACREIV_10085, partial [Planctomycetaceae bacterium]